MAPITNSLVFRLFDEQALRMRAMTVMIVVGHERLHPRPACSAAPPWPT